MLCYNGCEFNTAQLEVPTSATKGKAETCLEVGESGLLFFLMRSQGLGAKGINTIKGGEGRPSDSCALNLGGAGDCSIEFVCHVPLFNSSYTTGL